MRLQPLSHTVPTHLVPHSVFIQSCDFVALLPWRCCDFVALLPSSPAQNQYIPAQSLPGPRSVIFLRFSHVVPVVLRVPLLCDFLEFSAKFRYILICSI